MKNLNKEQLELLKNLEKLWEENPEQRFGQLLFNYTRIGSRAELGMVIDPFFYQDGEILDDIKQSCQKKKTK